MSLQTATFRYLLGELRLAAWRVPVVRLAPPDSSDAAWPRPEDVNERNLPAGAAAWYCERVAVDRFPVGLSRAGQWLSYVPRRECLFVVDLSGTFEAYLARRSAKSRHNLRRSVKKLLDRNPAGAMDIFTAPEDMARFHREGVAISNCTYQARLLGAGLPDTPEFLRAMEDRARQGEARAYLLRDQGQPIAFAWCTSRDRSMTYNVIGYLPESAALSPGTVLLYLILQDLFASGRYDILDFGVGEAFYKSAFATGHIEFSQAYLFRPRWRYRWRLVLLWRMDRFSTWLGAFLKRMGVKEQIRKWIRKVGTRGNAAPVLPAGHAAAPASPDSQA